MNKTRYLNLLVLGLIFFLPSFSVLATDPLQPSSYRLPMSEVLDLKLDGNSSHPAMATFTKDFDFISRMMFHLSWDGSSLDFDKFGDGTALTNGLFICINGEALTDDNITSIKDFGKYAYDSVIHSDEKNPKGFTLHSRWSFWKLTGNEGLDVRPNEVSLCFYIGDNLTLATYAINEFVVTVQGFRVIDLGIQYSDSWITDITNFDSLTDYIFAGLLLPLILMSSSDEWTFWLGALFLLIEIGLAYAVIKVFLEAYVI